MIMQRKEPAVFFGAEDDERATPALTGLKLPVPGPMEGLPAGALFDPAPPAVDGVGGVGMAAAANAAALGSR